MFGISCSPARRPQPARRNQVEWAAPWDRVFQLDESVSRAKEVVRGRKGAWHYQQAWPSGSLSRRAGMERVRGSLSLAVAGISRCRFFVPPLPNPLLPRRRGSSVEDSDGGN